jgi:arsenite methyltransferase
MNKPMQHPQYGIDAPGLLRFFGIAGTAALSILLIALFTALLGPILKILIALMAGIAATYLLGMGSLMLYYSKVEKLKDCDRLLNLVQWSGQEQVLDVGCGRGLLLIAAAKRLSSGRAIGVDLWQQQDQADNHPAATQKNARIEGVADRALVQTADMRDLPFPEQSFDVVLSSWAIHNLEEMADRQTALNEIVRVLKPGGMLVLADIVNQTEYAQHLQQCGLADVRLHNNRRRDTILKAVSFGSFAPSAITARKAHP